MILRYVGRTTYSSPEADTLFDYADKAFGESSRHTGVQKVSGVGYVERNVWYCGALTEYSYNNKSYWWANTPDMELWLMVNAPPGYTIFEGDPLEDMRTLP